MDNNALLMTSIINSINNPTNFEPARTIFVGDLSYFCQEENLITFFAAAGMISRVKIGRGKSGKPLHYGFVEYMVPESTLRAFSELNNKEFMGRFVKIDLGKAHVDKVKKPQESFVQIHVSFVSYQINQLVDEITIRSIFSEFGEVLDVVVKEFNLREKTRAQAGYGFVNYTNLASANAALAFLEKNSVRNIRFDCKISYKSIDALHGPPTTASSTQYNGLNEDVYSGDIYSTSSGSVSGNSSHHLPMHQHQVTAPQHQTQYPTYSQFRDKGPVVPAHPSYTAEHAVYLKRELDLLDQTQGHTFPRGITNYGQLPQQKSISPAVRMGANFNPSVYPVPPPNYPASSAFHNSRPPTGAPTYLTNHQPSHIPAQLMAGSGLLHPSVGPSRPTLPNRANDLNMSHLLPGHDASHYSLRPDQRMPAASYGGLGSHGPTLIATSASGSPPSSHSLNAGHLLSHAHGLPHLNHQPQIERTSSSSPSPPSNTTDIKGLEERLHGLSFFQPQNAIAQGSLAQNNLSTGLSTSPPSGYTTTTTSTTTSNNNILNSNVNPTANPNSSNKFVSYPPGIVPANNNPLNSTTTASNLLSKYHQQFLYQQHHQQSNHEEMLNQLISDERLADHEESESSLSGDSYEAPSMPTL